MAKTIELHKSKTTIEKLHSGYLYETGNTRHAKSELNVHEDLANTIEKQIKNLRPGQSIVITLLIES